MFPAATAGLNSPDANDSFPNDSDCGHDLSSVGMANYITGSSLSDVNDDGDMELLQEATDQAQMSFRAVVIVTCGSAG